MRECSGGSTWPPGAEPTRKAHDGEISSTNMNNPARVRQRLKAEPSPLGIDGKTKVRTESTANRGRWQRLKVKWDTGIRGHQRHGRPQGLPNTTNWIPPRLFKNEGLPRGGPVNGYTYREREKQRLGKQDRASVIRTSGVRQEASTPKSKDAPGGEGRIGMMLSWEALCTTWALRIPEAVPPGGLRAWLPRSGVTLHYSCAV